MWDSTGRQRRTIRKLLKKNAVTLGDFRFTELHSAKKKSYNDLIGIGFSKFFKRDRNILIHQNPSAIFTDDDLFP